MIYFNNSSSCFFPPLFQYNLSLFLRINFVKNVDHNSFLFPKCVFLIFLLYILYLIFFNLFLKHSDGKKQSINSLLECPETYKTLPLKETNKKK